MRRTLSLAVALLMAGGIAAPAFAQAQQQVTIVGEMDTKGIAMEELHDFGQLAIAHRKMARRLATNPSLADDNDFLKKYPELNRFFSKYPGSKERFLANPGNYLEGVHGHPRKVAMHHRAKAKQMEKKSDGNAAEAKPSESAAPPAAGSSNP
ncbi:MAG TPA: hypothetical protein VFB33_07385 [Candidatus Binataceae bacterium]|jgi:hypothetical protein|nr:hypothetical protein [Candidatus Binataceae bacterium]